MMIDNYNDDNEVDVWFIGVWVLGIIIYYF